jgi:mono/diheme cytochrome c family protein
MKKAAGAETSLRRWWHTALIFVVLGGSVAILAGQEKAGKRSVWEGVYLDAQADRGQAQYERSCAACHHSDLQGDSGEEIPALADEAFIARWTGKTVGDLFEKISRSMPAANPGSLGTQQYVDIVAYLLQANKFPSGREELGGSAAELGRIVFAKAADGVKR